MAGQNGLQFEIGVRDEQAVKTLKQLQRDTADTAKEFDKTTKALNDMITTLSRISDAKKVAKGALDIGKGLGLDNKVLKDGLRQVEELEKKIKNVSFSGGVDGVQKWLKTFAGAELGVMLKELRQVAKEQESVNKATERYRALQSKKRTTTEQNELTNLKRLSEELTKLSEKRQRLSQTINMGKGLGMDMSTQEAALQRLIGLFDSLSVRGQKWFNRPVKSFNNLLFGYDYKRQIGNIDKVVNGDPIQRQQKNTEALARAEEQLVTQMQRMKSLASTPMYDKDKKALEDVMGRLQKYLDMIRQLKTDQQALNSKNFFSDYLGKRFIENSARNQRAIQRGQEAASRYAKDAAAQNRADATRVQNLERITAAQNKLITKTEQLKALERSFTRAGQAVPVDVSKALRKAQSMNNALEYLRTRPQVNSADFAPRFVGAGFERKVQSFGLTANRANEDLRQLASQSAKAQSGIMAAARAEEQLVRSMQQATDAAKQQGRVFSEMKNWAQMYFSFYGAKDLLQNIIEVGGQFEVQHIALQNILGDMREGSTVYNQIKDLSVESPFSFSQLISNTKQLSAYAIPYEELYDTTKRLSDLSAGLGVDFYRLSLAYGQVRSASVLRGQELRQFTEAGIPMVQALADKFTELNGEVVTTNDVLNKLVPGKQVPFEMVKEVLTDMTNEGGRFYNMQEKLADTLAGKWSNLRDAWEIMLSDVAKGSTMTGSILKTAVSGLTQIIHLLGTIAPSMMMFGTMKIAAGSINGVMAKSSNAQAIMKGHESFRQSALVAGASVGDKNLSAIQRDILNSKGKIVAKEAQLLVKSDMLTRNDALRLGLQGKLDEKTLRYLSLNKIITTEQRMQIMNGSRMSKTLTLMGLKVQALKSSFVGFLASNGWFLAISAVVGIITTIVNKSEAAKARMEELTQSLQEKAQGLQQEFSKIGSGSNLGLKELEAGIDRMLDTLKKNESRYDYNATKEQASAIEDLAKRYDYLAEKVERAKNAAADIADHPDTINAASSEMEDVGDKMQEWERANRYLTQMSGRLHLMERDVDAYLAKLPASLTRSLEGLSLEQKVAKLARLPKIGEEYNRVIKVMEGYRTARQNFQNEAAGIVGEANKAISVLMGQDYGSALFRSMDMEGRSEYIKTQIRESINQFKEGTVEAKAAAADYTSQSIDQIMQFCGRFASISTQAGEAAYRFIQSKLAAGWDFSNLTKEQLAAVNTFTTEALRQYRKSAGDVKNSIEAEQIMATLRVKLKVFFDTEENVELDDYGKYMAGRAQKVMGNYVLNGKTYTPAQFAYKFRGGVEARQQALVEKYNGADESLKRLKMLPDKIKKNGKLVDNTYKRNQIALQTQQKNDALSQWQLEFPEGDITQFTAKGKIKNPPKGSHEDKLLKTWRQRMSQLDKIDSLYDLLESGGMEEGNIVSNIRRSNMSYAKLLPKDVVTKEQLKAWINRQRKQMTNNLPRSSEERNTFIDETLKKLFEVDKDRMKDGLKSLGEILQRSIKEGTSKWDFYKSVRDKLGVSVADMLAGGAVKNSDVIRSNIEMMLPQIGAVSGGNASFSSLVELYKNHGETGFKGTGYEEIAKYIEQYLEALRQEEKEMEDRVVGAMEQSRTSYEKLQHEIEKAEMMKNAIRGSRLSQEEKDQATASIDAQTSEKILKQSADYMNFFNAVLTMTEGKAEEVGAKIRANLDDKLRLGVMTAEEYYQELDRVEGQLDKLRNKKSDSWALFSGGLSGLYANREEKYTSERNKAAEDVKQYSAYRLAAEKKGLDAEADYWYSKEEHAREELANAEKQLRLARRQKTTLEDVSETFSKISDVASSVEESVNGVVSVAEALGEDVTSGTAWTGLKDGVTATSKMADGISKSIDAFKNKDILSGVTSVIGAATAAISFILSNWDNKLDAQIELASATNALLENMKSNLEKLLGRTLGGVYTLRLSQEERQHLTDEKDRKMKFANIGYGRVYDTRTREQMQKALDTDSYYEAQLAELMGQRDVVNDQLYLENMKKNKNAEKVEDYRQKIRELDDEVRYFAQDMAKALYDIDIKSWASQLGDSLFDAWKKGMNAIDAYKEKLAELIAQTSKNIITTRVLEVAMEKPMEWLTGRMEELSGKLYEQDVMDFARQVGEATEGVIPALLGAYDALENGLNKEGMTMKETGTASGGNVIRGITEDQADILISYINGMRADLSIHVQDLRDLMERTMPDMSRSFEAQLGQLRAIEENTRRSAVGVESLNDTLNSIVMGVKSLKVR